MKHKHLHVYWIQGVFRWTLVVTYTPILEPTYYTNSTFSPLNKEQSFDFIKNKKLYNSNTYMLRSKRFHTSG